MINESDKEAANLTAPQVRSFRLVGLTGQMIAYNVDHARVYSYKILEIFCMQKEGFYTLPQLPNMLAQSYFSHVEYLDPHHLNSFFRTYSMLRANLIYQLPWYVLLLFTSL